MVTVPFAVYDAFSDVPFGGSQACIVSGAGSFDAGLRERIAKEIGMPATGFIDGRNVPTVWGIAYANTAFMIGVVYSKEYLVSGLVIFAGAILAIAMPLYNGYILGPFMGLGIMSPGVIAERRVRAIRMSDGEG